MQDNTNPIIIQSSLTRLGRKRLTESRFSITKFAVSDDGINYALINGNLPQPEIYLERMPLFSVWKDGASVVRNKIPMDKPSIPSSVFSYNIQTIKPNSTVLQPNNTNKNESNPILAFNTQSKTVEYEFVDVLQCKTITNTVFRLPYFNLPIASKRNHDNFISVTLHDNRYFDIGVEPNYATLIANGSAQNLLARNFQSALTVTESGFSTLPKTINLATTDQIDATFILMYKGNYPFKNIGTDRFETMLTIFCEESGATEDIRLTIKLSTPKNSN